MSIAFYAAIAVLIALVFLWLLLQPKQGQTASNQGSDTDDRYLSESSETNQDEEIEQTAKELMLQGKKIAALKFIRQKKGLGLKDAKRYLESIDSSSNQLTHSNDSSELRDEVKELIDQSQVIEAIKLIRIRTGFGLKEAKDYVSKIQNENRNDL